MNTAIAETIFIVDDDEAVRDSLQALLESFGLTVESYRSGLEFLAAGVSGEGGCLLLDLRMSLMSGLYVLEALAKDGISMPVIMVTATAHPVVKARALELGAVAVLEKPLEDMLLLDTIRSALKKP